MSTINDYSKQAALTEKGVVIEEYSFAKASFYDSLKPYTSLPS